jgi:amino acid adenylation domain-containing protein
MPELLQDWVVAQADRRPDATAVIGDGERLTYAQLEVLSNRIARVLKASGCRRGDRICLLMPKSPRAIAGLLGIYKADCIYVPLDSASPPGRLAKLLRACESRWILAASPVTPVLDETLRAEQLRGTISVGWMDTRRPEAGTFIPEFTLDDLSAYSSEPRARQNSSGDAAHLLFTSGSTGTPKGVVITHANVIPFVEWGVKYFEMSPSDRISGHPPLHFDLSVFDIFGTFCAGAELHLVPPELNVLPNKLADFIRAAALTQWFSVPSLLTYMARFDVVQFNDFPALERLLWCGEVFPTPALIYWMRRLPHVTFTNLYGPTEATIASSYYTVPQCPEDETASIPIGTACPGEQLLVLDEHLQPVGPGEVGDLYIGGVGLSPGYWRDPDKTRSVFVPHPESPDSADRIYKTGDLATIGDDELVYFLGRADSQIKSRGHRIELGEIEAALNGLGCLAECAVVAIETKGFEGATICCAFVPSPRAEVTLVGLRKQLSTLLPNYMLPFRWMALEELPKNVNGKIDRRKLKEAFEVHAAEAHR